MKRIFKSLVAMVLALALAFTFAPASAQAAGLKFRQGTLGKTYKLPVVLPGNVQVKANVTVSDYYTVVRNGVTVTYAKCHVEYPKKQKNIIKRNTTRILQNCPVKKTSGFMKTVFGPADLAWGVYDSTGKLATKSPYLDYAYGIVGNATETSFYQGRNTLRMLTSYDVEFGILNMPSVTGTVYAGIASATKPVTSNNKKYKKLLNGSGTLKKAGFFQKSGKNGVFFAG